MSLINQINCMVFKLGKGFTLSKLEFCSASHVSQKLLSQGVLRNIPYAQNAAKLCSTTENCNNDKFTDEENSQILLSLNSLSLEDMKHIFMLTDLKRYARIIPREICNHRENNGPFTCISQLSSVKKVGPKTKNAIMNCLKKETMHLLSEKDKTRSKEKDLRFFSPSLTTSILKDVDCITSVEIAVNATHFATVNRNEEVCDWGHLDHELSSHKTQSLDSILDQSHAIVSSLPDPAGLFLMEHRVPRQSRSGTPLIQLHLFVARLQMATMILLNPSLLETGQHRVIQVRDAFLSSQFDLRVGGERVSCQSVVAQQEPGQDTECELTIPPRLWKRYTMHQSDIGQERYAHCLLMAWAGAKTLLKREQIS